MLEINQEILQKISNVNILLNQLEVRGANNIDILYHSLLLLQQSLQEIKDLNDKNIELRKE